MQKGLGFYIRRLDNLMRHRMDQTRAKADVDNITGLHGFLVGYLCHHEGEKVYQRDMERDLKMGRSTLTAILQLMEKNGLILRSQAQCDARMKEICLTEKARSMAMEFQQEIHRTESLMEEGISKEELEAFRAVLLQMIANLEKQEPCGSGNEDTCSKNC